MSRCLSAREKILTHTLDPHQTADSLEARLAGEGAMAMSGRLEVMYQGTWGTVCDDDFGLVDADVACRQLGFAVADMILKGEQNPFGSGAEDSPIYMDDVACTGKEDRLNQCPFQGISRTNCNHREDVAITCTTGMLLCILPV